MIDEISIAILLNNENVPKDIFLSTVDDYFGPQLEDFKESSLAVCVLSDRTGMSPSQSNMATFSKSQWFFQTNFPPNEIFEFKIVICENKSWNIISMEDSLDGRLVQTFNTPPDKIMVVHFDWNKPHTVSEQSLSELLSLDESFIKSHYENQDLSESFQNLETITEDNNDDESLLDSLHEQFEKNEHENEIECNDSDDSLETGKNTNFIKEQMEIPSGIETNKTKYLSDIRIIDTDDSLEENKSFGFRKSNESFHTDNINEFIEIKNENNDKNIHDDNLKSENTNVFEIPKSSSKFSARKSILLTKIQSILGVKSELDKIKLSNNNNDEEEAKELEHTKDNELSSMIKSTDNSNFKSLEKEFYDSNLSKLSNEDENNRFSNVLEVTNNNDNIVFKNENSNILPNENDHIPNSVNLANEISNDFSDKKNNIYDECELAKKFYNENNKVEINNCKNKTTELLQIELSIEKELKIKKAPNIECQLSIPTNFNDNDVLLETVFDIEDSIKNANSRSCIIPLSIPCISILPKDDIHDMNNLVSPTINKANVTINANYHHDIANNSEICTIDNLPNDIHMYINKDGSNLSEEIFIKDAFENHKHSIVECKLANVIDTNLEYENSKVAANVEFECKPVHKFHELHNINNLENSIVNDPNDLKHEDNFKLEDRTIISKNLIDDFYTEKKYNSDPDTNINFANNEKLDKFVCENDILSEKNQIESVSKKLNAKNLIEFENIKNENTNNINESNIEIENTIIIENMEKHPEICVDYNSLEEIKLIKTEESNNLEYFSNKNSGIKDNNKINVTENKGMETSSKQSSNGNKLIEFNNIIKEKNENFTEDLEINPILNKINFEQPDSLQNEIKPKVFDIIEKFETLTPRDEISINSLTNKEKECNRISKIIKQYEELNIQNEDEISGIENKRNTIKMENNENNFQKTLEIIHTDKDNFTTHNIESKDTASQKLNPDENSDNKQSELRINDDYKYPDSVTPTKVEHGLMNLAKYDVPFIDDDVFYKENWYKESSDRWSTLERSKSINKEFCLNPDRDGSLKNTPQVSIETLNESEIEKIKMSIESRTPERKRKGLLNLCGCVGGRKRS